MHPAADCSAGGTKCSPRKGYLALEAEGSECRFRNIKIKELPTSNPKPEEIAIDGTGEHASRVLAVAPVLLGSGERLFDGVGSFGLEPVEVLHSPLATHIRYRRAS